MIPDLPKALFDALKIAQDEDKWGDGHLHVSDLAVALPESRDAKCARGLWGRVHGWEKKEESVGQRLMKDHGNRIHERMVELLEVGLAETPWIIIGVEVDVTNGLPDGMTGHADLLLKNEETEEVVVVDFKTIRGRAFNFLDKPKSSNRLQIQTYMKVFNAAFGILFYIDREGQNQPVQFIIQRDDDMVEKATEFAQRIVALPEAPRKMLPIVEVGKNKGPDSVKLKLPWQCEYCDFRDVSCDGALKEENRGQIVGYINKDTKKFESKEKYNGMFGHVVSLLRVSGLNVEE